jgi:endonuclease-3
MNRCRRPLPEIIKALEKAYGRPGAPPATGPLEMILWENVAYLVDDERHERAFVALKERVGTDPVRILAAPRELLLEVAKLGGMKPELRVEKLREIARIALQECGGDLEEVVRRPLPEARKILEMFPAIGEPGADRILMFAGAAPVLALDSNGLRVLQRLGFGEEKKSYALGYRSARETAMAGIRKDARWLAHAHLALRRHGRTLCRRSNPACDLCPLSGWCHFNLTQRRV